MQYLLTEEEYKLFKSYESQVRELGAAADKKKLQKFCSWVANNTPIKYWSNEDAQIWGCILSEDGENMHDNYCDECPSQDFCPCEYKNWSE